MLFNNKTLKKSKLPKFTHNFFSGFYHILCSVFIPLSVVFNPTLVKSQTAHFTINPVGGNFCAPAQVRFNSNFSETPLGINWRLGVGNNESSAANPAFTYTAPGTYKVVLTVLFDSALITVEEFVTILERPTLTISQDRNFICAPGQINFTAQSNQPLSNIAWDFGDGTPILNDDTLAVSHFFNNFTNYTIRAVATNTDGCSNAPATTTVSLKRLTANLTSTPDNGGCIPANIRLRANVTAPTGSTKTSHIWDFGDGTPVNNTNAQDNTTYTYNTVTGVVPSVTVITSEGCTETFVFDPLVFGTPPQNFLFSSLKDSFCFSENVKFTATAVLANEYRWNFGDGQTLITTDTAVSYRYKSRGDYNVTVQSFYNGCGSPLQNVPISIIGPQANFSFSNTCTDKASFNFANTSFGLVDSVYWNFGTGGNTSSLYHPSYTFPPTGTHNTRLIVIENTTGCADTLVKSFYTAVPTINSSSDAACLNGMVSLNLNGNYSNPAARYNFTIAGRRLNDLTGSSATLTADTVGIFTNQVVIINGPGYCNDTIIQADPIRIGGPVLNFAIPNLLCISDSLQPINNSVAGFAYDTIVNWKWNFGDSTLIDSVQSPAPFVYANPGNYSVSLSATDNNGCANTMSTSITVRSLPLLLTSSGNSLICPNDTINLLALHQGNIIWSPSATLDCDSCSSVLAFPGITTNYIATAIDTFGCKAMDTSYVNVQTAYNFNHMLRDTLVCFGQSVQLDLGINDLIYQWTPSLGLSANDIRNPVATTLASTLYRVNVTDTLGCTPRFAEVLVAIAPLPTIDSIPDLVVPYNNTFTITPSYGPDIATYLWQPGIPVINCSNCANPGGIALESTEFTVTVTSTQGCVASGNFKLFVACDENNLYMPTGFSPNRDNLNDYFYPLTRGVKEIRRFQIYNRFGQIVFERYNIKPNDNSFGWDGTFKGVPQASGNYMYIMDAVCDLNGIISKKGSVMLIR